jgi:ribonuclease BN (tRNA processing enzyme)
MMGASSAYQLTFLGSGSAFYLGDHVGENWQSNVLIQSPSGRRLLIDCGTDIRFSLKEQGLSVTDIDDVFISHLHADHIGGLEWLAFGCKFSAQGKKPHLWANQQIVKELWWQSLRGGLGSLEGEEASMHSYFNVHAIRENGVFDWEGIRFRLVQVVHIMDGYKISPSYGLLFELGGTRVFFTADTQFAPSQINQFYRGADLILHDCETAAHKSGVHAHYEQLRGLPADIKRKMWLYHFQPGKKADARSDGFAGWIEKGRSFVFEHAPAVAA